MIGGKYLARKGQILYSKIRPNLKKVTIAPCDCLCSADMYAISTNKDVILPEYLILIMLSQPFTNYVVDYSMRVAMPKVNRIALGNCWLWFPKSLNKQHMIVDAIKTECLPIDRMLTTISNQVLLLNEFYIRLTSDAVTGKLDLSKISKELIDISKNSEEAFVEPETMRKAYG